MTIQFDLTNEHISVARLCIDAWKMVLEITGRSTSGLQDAVDVLVYFERAKPEHRSGCLSCAWENDRGNHISVEDLEMFVWTINEVIQFHFDGNAPIFVQQTRQFFFDVLCKRKGALLRGKLGANIALATKLTEADRSLNHLRAEEYELDSE